LRNLYNLLISQVLHHLSKVWRWRT